LTGKIVGVSSNTFRLPFVAFERGEGLAVVADIWSGTAQALAVVRKSIAIAVVVRGLTILAQERASVLLSATPADASVRVDVGGGHIAAGGEICRLGDGTSDEAESKED